MMDFLNSLRFDTIAPEKEIVVKFEKGVGVILINPEGVIDFIFCKDDLGEASESAMFMSMLVQVMKTPELLKQAMEITRKEAANLNKVQ